MIVDYDMLCILFLVHGIYPTSVSSLRRHHILEGAETWLRYENKENVNFHFNISVLRNKNFLFTPRKSFFICINILVLCNHNK